MLRTTRFSSPRELAGERHWGAAIALVDTLPRAGRGAKGGGEALILQCKRNDVKQGRRWGQRRAGNSPKTQNVPPNGGTACDDLEERKHVLSPGRGSWGQDEGRANRVFTGAPVKEKASRYCCSRELLAIKPLRSQ